MTWLAQIGHVARKDVRHFWWLFVLYAAIVAGVTANTRAGLAAASIIVTLDAFIVVAFGMATAATLVQSDSPSRRTAFWATLPFDPSAVLAAKVVMITVLVIGIGVLGEVIGLRALDPDRTVIASFVMRSIGLYAIWLVAAVSIAALTPDFRAFAITLLVVVIAFLALAQGLIIDRFGALHLSTSVPAAGALIALGALAYHYQHREAPRAVWGVASVGVFSAFLFLLATAERGTASGAESARSSPITLSGTGGVLNRDQLVLHLRAENADTLHSYTFVCDSLIAHLADGSTVPLEPRFGATYLQSASLPAVGAVRWRPEPRFRNIGVASYGLNADERAALAQGVSAIDVAGRVNEYVPELSAEIPLRAGQSVVRDGERLRIGRVLHTADSLSIDLLRSSLARPESFSLAGNDGPDPFAWAPEATHFALVNRSRREGVLLNGRGNETSNGWVVLPGAPIQQSMTHLAPMRVLFARDTLPRDAAWYSNAHLYVFRWRAGGTYRVHARIVVP